MSVEKLVFQLAQAGLNLFSVLDRQACGDLQISDSMKTVLLIGNSGPALWQAMPASYFARENPVDEYSADTISLLVPTQLPDVDWQTLFPAEAGANAPNLLRLGSLAGWHHPSPLGNGINQQSGLWFAYRAVVAIDLWIPASEPPVDDSPCISCADTPCIAACPAAALKTGESPNLRSCVNFRSETKSSCAQTCLARLACPVANEWRYPAEQIRYFYDRSLPSLRRWVAGESGVAD